MKSILNYVGLIFLAIFCLPYFFVKPVLKYFNIAKGNRFGDASESFFIYMFALSLTVILPKFTKLHLPYVSLFIDAMAALIVAFLPSDLNDFIALYRCILQWQFSGVPLKVGMDLPALQFFLRITCVSLQHLWQNIFAVKIPTP